MGQLHLFESKFAQEYNSLMAGTYESDEQKFRLEILKSIPQAEAEFETSGLGTDRLTQVCFVGEKLSHTLGIPEDLGVAIYLDILKKRSENLMAGGYYELPQFDKTRSKEFPRYLTEKEQRWGMFVEAYILHRLIGIERFPLWLLGQENLNNSKQDNRKLLEFMDKNPDKVAEFMYWVNLQEPGTEPKDQKFIDRFVEQAKAGTLLPLSPHEFE